MLDANKIYHDLKSQLRALDGERRRHFARVKPWQYFLWFILWIAGPFLLLRFNVNAMQGYLFSEEQKPFVIMWWSGCFVVSLVAFAIAHNINMAKFKKMFAEQVGPKIIGRLGPDFHYEYEGKIDEEIIESSLLFEPFSGYTCQDLVTGSLGEVPVIFGEICLSKTVKTKEKSEQREFFKGIFFQAQLPLTFPTGIWIIGPKFNKSRARTEKQEIEINHEEFRRYAFYTDDVETAQKVLQTVVLDKIAALNQKLKKEARISFGKVRYHFEGRQLEVAIPTFGRFLEPRLSQSLLDVKIIEDQVVVLNALSSLMKDLSLA